MAMGQAGLGNDGRVVEQRRSFLGARVIRSTKG